LGMGQREDALALSLVPPTASDRKMRAAQVLASRFKTRR
jgi:hypothetical protein